MDTPMGIGGAATPQGPTTPQTPLQPRRLRGPAESLGAPPGVGMGQRTMRPPSQMPQRNQQMYQRHQPPPQQGPGGIGFGREVPQGLPPGMAPPGVQMPQGPPPEMNQMLQPTAPPQMDPQQVQMQRFQQMRQQQMMQQQQQMQGGMQGQIDPRMQMMAYRQAMMGMGQ